MSTFNKLTWPKVDQAAVCASQNLGAAGDLLLNGTLQTVTPNPENLPVYFAKVNLIRSVSITSVNNLSTINFVIQGFQNNAYVSESIGGPNNNTVYGAKHYDIITKVTVSAPVTAVSVGTGSTGYFPLLVINPNAGNINYSAQVITKGTAITGINYSLLQTLDQIFNNFYSLDDQINQFFPCMGMTSQTGSDLKNATVMANFILFKVNTSANPLTDTFDFVFLQE